MKNVFLIVITVLCSVAVHATDITVYDMNSKGNPGAVITESWIKALEQQGYQVTYRGGMGCAGRDLFVKDQGAALGIVFAGRVWGSLDRGEDQCVVDLDRTPAISSYEYTIELCTRSDSGLAASDLLGDRPLKIGFNDSNNPHRYWTLALNRLYGVNHKPVGGYKNSGAVTLAILSGDIDLGMTSSLSVRSAVAEGKLKCLATTDSAQDHAFVKLFSRIDPLLNQFNGVYGVLANNLSDRQRQEINSIITAVGKKLADQDRTGLRVSDQSEQRNQQYLEQVIRQTLSVTKQ